MANLQEYLELLKKQQQQGEPLGPVKPELLDQLDPKVQGAIGRGVDQSQAISQQLGNIGSAIGNTVGDVAGGVKTFLTRTLQGLPNEKTISEMDIQPPPEGQPDLTSPGGAKALTEQIIKNPAIPTPAPSAAISTPQPSISKPPIGQQPSSPQQPPQPPQPEQPIVADPLDQYLKDAAEQKRKLRMQEGFDQMMHGIAGTKRDPNAYAGLIKDSQDKVRDYLLKRRQAEATKKSKFDQDYKTRTLDLKEKELSLKRAALGAKKAKGSLEYKDVRKMTNNNRGVQGAAKTVVRDFSEALKILKPWDKQGIVGASFRKGSAMVPGTEMYDLQMLIDSAKSNIGIDKLLEIKASGAGLGQVPQSQLETLQSVLGKMDLGRDPQKLKRDIEQAVKTYQDVIKRTETENAELSKEYPEFSKRLGIGSTPSGVPSDEDINNMSEAELKKYLGQ